MVILNVRQREIGIMSDTSKPPSRLSTVPAAIISIVVSGLLGLAAGAKMDDIVEPTVGTTGAFVAGCLTVLVVFMGIGIVSYRSLTR